MRLFIWEKKFRNIKYDVFEWSCCGKIWQLLDDQSVIKRDFKPLCFDCGAFGLSIEDLRSRT